MSYFYWFYSGCKERKHQSGWCGRLQINLQFWQCILLLYFWRVLPYKIKLISLLKFCCFKYFDSREVDGVQWNEDENEKEKSEITLGYLEGSVSESERRARLWRRLSRCFLASTPWTTFVLSKQSMQFVLKTPLCFWLKPPPVKKNPNCLNSSLICAHSKLNLNLY